MVRTGGKGRICIGPRKIRKAATIRTTIGTGTTTPATATWATRASIKWILPAGSSDQPAVSPRVVSFGGRFGYEDAGNTANTQVVLHDYPGAPIIFETRGLPSSKAAHKDKATWFGSMDKYHGSQVGVVVHCEHGMVVSTSKYDEVKVFGPDGEEIKTFHGGGEKEHFMNFLTAVRSRKRSDLHADVLEGSPFECPVPHGQYLAPVGRAAHSERDSWRRPRSISGCTKVSSECSLICGRTKSISTSRRSRPACGWKWTRRRSGSPTTPQPMSCCAARTASRLLFRKLLKISLTTLA